MVRDLYIYLHIEVALASSFEMLYPVSLYPYLCPALCMRLNFCPSYLPIKCGNLYCSAEDCLCKFDFLFYNDIIPFSLKNRMLLNNYIKIQISRRLSANT